MLNNHKKTQPMAQGDMIGLSLVFELGYLIAIPIVVCALGGRLMDRYCGTSPVFLLVGIGVAMVISGMMVMMRIRDMERVYTTQQTKRKSRDDVR